MRHAFHFRLVLLTRANLRSAHSALERPGLVGRLSTTGRDTQEMDLLSSAAETLAAASALATSAAAAATPLLMSESASSSSSSSSSLTSSLLATAAAASASGTTPVPQALSMAAAATATVTATAAVTPSSSAPTSWVPASVLLILRSLLALPYRFLGYLSSTVTATVTFNYWSLLLIASLLILIGYLILRYRVLTTYSRLPASTRTRKTVGVPFDLHPDTAFHDDGDRGNYPDELMGAFLSSIKIFGYLDRPVFHELARHLRTRKLKAGEVLFRSEDDVRDFFVVVDGTVQVFVKGAEEKEGELFTEGADSDDSADDGSSSAPIGNEWAGHHLLNEVRAGGTVSSLFNILSVFTEKTEVPPSSGAGTPGVLPRTASHESNGSSTYQEVFPNLRRGDSPQGHSPPATQDGSHSSSPRRVSIQDAMHHPGIATEPTGFNFDVPQSPQNISDTQQQQQPQRPQLHRIFTTDPYTRLHPNIATRAATDTTLAVIPAEAFQQLTEKFPKAAAHMVQVILTRFQRVTFMTLYRYLGLSKELLKIEKRVNEISGFGLPENLLSLADFQKLRNRANKVVRGMHDQSMSDAVLRTDNNHNKRRGGGSPDAPAATLRPRRYSKHRERWVDESDFEDGTGRAASTAGDPPRLAKPKHPKDLKGYLLDTNYDDIELKESIFACIAQIIGIFPRDQHHVGGGSHSGGGGGGGSVSGGGGGLGHSPLTASSRAASTTLGGFLSRNRSYMDGQARSSPMTSNSDFDDTASSSSRVSISSSMASDTGASDLHLMFYERGATLIKEGERNAGLYFVIDGILEASVRSNPDPYRASTHDQQLLDKRNGNDKDENPGAHRRSLFLIKPGGLAGYLAAVTGYISFVSIRAKTDVYVGFLPKNVLDRYIERHPSVLLSLAKRLISQLSPLVFHIDAALGWDQANAGQILCREGDPSDCIYIVLNGRLRSIVERAKENDDQPPAFEILSEYGQGESVGEMEVLTDGRRPATVHAIRDTEIAVMPKTFFNALALRHPEITIAISRIIAARSRQSLKRGALGGVGGGGGGGGGGGEMPVNNTWDPPRSVASAKSMVNVNMRTVAILPVNSLVPVADFARELHNAMELVGASVAVLNNGSVMNTLGKQAFSRIGRLKLMSWLADLEESHRMVIYVADGGVGSPWTQRCVRQADCVFLVGLGDEDPEIGDYERLLIGMKTTARKELVLVHSSRSCISGSTAAWLKNRVWVHAHHHVQMQLSAPRMLAEATRTNTVSNLRQHFSSYPHGAGGPSADRTQLSGGGLSSSSLTAKLQTLGNVMVDATPGHSPLHLHTGIRSDFARLARRLLSRSVGLVLGGGGARGISHIGIIRALEEAGIPVDMVGGTSIGSFVGGLYARDNDHVAVYGRAKMFAGRIVSKWRQILDLTYPVTAMFTGHEFNRSIWKCFKETQIEDCWLPYFAVTTNITHSRMEVHQTGYMWRYVRASMSLSGYLPPLCDNGNMLLDGGYLNNLPADLMRAQQGAHTIIAVDVGSVDDTSPVNYGDSLSGWWALAQRYIPILGPAMTRKYGQIPLMADIQSRLTYVSSVKQLEDAKALDGVYYLNPHVQMYGTLEFDKFGEIFDVGYRYGTGIVEKWRKDGTLRARFGVREGHGDGGWGRHARRASI
ncbi:phosphatidylcholine and lysophosphatidylcholine phospholipase [Geranomyces michiganensis]|nr:phosphatidylcholine and lysophosphatidylcholine phospholipase [Geranomyces michiganensis]